MAHREYGRTPVGAIIQGQLEKWFRQKTSHLQPSEEIAREDFHPPTAPPWLIPHLNNIPHGGLDSLHVLVTPIRTGNK